MEALWHPSAKQLQESNLAKYRDFLYQQHDIRFEDYHELWKWSVENVDLFWESIWKYFQVKSTMPYEQILSGNRMPGATWFEGSKLNYAQHIFSQSNAEFPAFISLSEHRDAQIVTWDDLENQVASLQSILKAEQIVKGDRVAAFVPNCAETSVTMLASISNGLVWSSCSPDFGVSSVIDRFLQINPKVFIATNGYSYNGKIFDKTKEVLEIIDAIPSIELVIWIDFVTIEIPVHKRVKSLLFKSCLSEKSELKFEEMEFNEPIWVLYSSGTTGLPKAITHSHGGMLLEHLKYISLQNNVKKGERFFWFSTAGWMMWNFVHASLLVGATAVLYDGSPAFADLRSLWQKADEFKFNHFGTSAPFLVACMKENLKIGEEFNLSNLKSIGSTGSPLPPEAFDYVYQNIKQDLWLCSMSGGTDVCTAFVGSCIERPVYRSEIQCRALGVSLEVWNENGDSVIKEMGEMVITKPMPCMPIYFWNDKENAKYKASYFELFLNVWRHGDWIEITEHDGLIIYGRSDSTLNRHGVRIGTAEIYNVLNQFTEIKDSLVLNLELKGGNHFMPIFIEMNTDQKLNSELITKIKNELKSQYSPRHIPDEFIQVDQIPYTISGKKMEGPVKKVLLNMDLKKAYNSDAMRNPESMNFFIEFRDQRQFEFV